MSLAKTGVLGCLLMAAISASATSHTDTIQLKVLDSETHSVSLGGNDVPRNCDQVNFDAYCNNSETRTVINTMVVQEGNQPPFRVSCTIDSRWSRCIPLPKGGSFAAKNAKRGVIVYYIDDKGKARSQLYTVVSGGRVADAPAAAVVAAAPRSSAPAAVTEKERTGHSSQTAPAPAAPSQAVPTAAAPPAIAGKNEEEKVRCDLISTPAGAEIVLDGKYVGSTPSKLGLSAGEHEVVFSLPGFAPWKRELTVTAGSELTVSAILQKASQ